MRYIFTAVLIAFAVNKAFAQSTTIKLPTAANTSSFIVTDSSSNVLMKMLGDDGFYLKGTFGTGAIPITGLGTRLLWYPKKAAFRTGTVDGTQWDDANIGNYSTAVGYGTKASASSSVATGSYTTANGIASFTAGQSTTASGIASLAAGQSTTASGVISTAMGYSTTASGDYSTAMGSYVSTDGYAGSFIIGDASTSVVTNAPSYNQIVMRFSNGYLFYTNSGATTGALLGSGANSWGTLSDSTKKENFLPVNGEDVLNKIDKFDLRTWNYKGQDPKEYRHYGPMAQEFFNAFGYDKYGVIGNDTTISQADFEGLLLVAVQALEKRTEEQKQEIRTQKQENEALRARLGKLETVVARLTDTEVAATKK